MKRIVSQGVVVLAGVLAVPAVGPDTCEPQEVADPRVALIREFFERYDSPAVAHAEDFVEAADRNDLDWRLLPGIAMVESGGGKAYKNNNIFGWDNCRKRFPSIKAGIHMVATRLGTSKLYQNKDTLEILQTYNADTSYSTRVLRLMRHIGPASPTGALAAAILPY